MLCQELLAYAYKRLLACLHDQNRNGLFWRAGFYPANQSNLKSLKKTLMGWKKAGPPKKPLLV